MGVEAWSVVAVVVGVLIAATVTVNIVRTLVITRARRTLLFDAVDQGVDSVFNMLARTCRSYERKDGVLAAQGAVVVLAQLVTWLVGYEVAYALLLVPTVHDLPAALREAGSSMFTLGFLYTHGNEPAFIDILAAATGMIVVALQIAYLPTLYGAFNRRETEVTLLGGRAGHPPWGPELLLRTRYGVAVKTVRDDLPDFYNRWERWAADVAESHSNYPVLVRFRSPHPLDSWLVGLLAVMDSAAMLLSLLPSKDRIEPRRAIRMGFTALREIGGALGMPVDMDPDPDADIALSFEDFAVAVDQLRAVGFPMERDAAEAWPHFRGWRVNYETLAYALAYRTDQVPAPWSGPRRWGTETIPVQRPTLRSPGKMIAGKVAPVGPAGPVDGPVAGPVDGPIGGPIGGTGRPGSQPEGSDQPSPAHKD
jgi:hypothetical protein